MIQALPASLTLAFGGVTGVLVASSAVIGALYVRERNKTTIELGQRVATWWVMFAVFTLSLALDARFFLLFAATLSTLALHEYFTLVGTHSRDRLVVRACFAAVLLHYGIIALGAADAALVFLPGFALLAVPTLALHSGETDDYLHLVSRAAFGLLLTTYGLGHLGLLLLSPVAALAPAGGVGLLVFLVLLTQFNDVFQYLAGKAFGRTKIAPRISPKKTVEGLAGGVVGSAVLAVPLGVVLLPLPLWCLPLIGVLLSLAGFLGDVTVSALKRDAGVKDASDLLPGHGGVLDRVDSAVFTAPLFFHALPFLIALT